MLSPIVKEEYWSARDLMQKLGYGNKWQNFEAVIKKAMTSCEETGNIIASHFTGLSKMVKVVSGAEHQVKDYYVDLICLALEGKASRLIVPGEQLGPAADLAPYPGKPADFRVPGQSAG